MELIGILRVAHVMTAIMMAWPAYALVAVNQRGRIGPPLGDRVDLYLEGVIKSRVVPCYVFQITALATGLWLMEATGRGLAALLSDGVMGAKLGLLLVVIGLLTVVRLGIQPRLDALFAAAGGGITESAAAEIRGLRLRRKQFASLCMFCVFAASMLGVQASAPFSLRLTALFLVLIAAFTWRTYKSETAYGWV